jgi:hypothetical protein
MFVQLLLPALAAPVPPLGSDHQLLGAGLQDPHHLKTEKEHSAHGGGISDSVQQPVLRIRIHFIRIRIQQFRLNNNPDPDPIRIQGFNDQKIGKKFQLKKKILLFFFFIKNYNLPIPSRPP